MRERKLSVPEMVILDHGKGNLTEQFIRTMDALGIERQYLSPFKAYTKLEKK